MVNYNKKYLSLLIGSILSTSSAVALAANEQDPQLKETDDDAVEVIEVRGIRNSLKESLFIKQNSIQVVDAIVAEDIGKFPDQNVAEALQRISGITITRNAGEGQNVTVRGLGGDYNITTINGRRMASEHSSRDFNYDLIAAELLGGVEVYKSPVAHTQEGGIGSVINIKTRRPMDFDGFTASGSIKGIYEDRTEDVTPQASFLLSDTFFDDTFGALFTAVYSERTLRIDSYEGEGFWNETTESDITVRQDVNGDGAFDPLVDNEWGSIIPGYMRYGNQEDTRERIGGSLALQWIPNSDFEMNFDSIYSSYKTDATESQISFVTYDESWTEGIPGVKDVGFNDEGLVNKMTLFGTGAMAEILNVSSPRVTETYQVGVNAKWFVADNFSVAFDVAHSSSENKNDGHNRYIVARGFVDEIMLDKSGNNLLPDVSISPNLTANSPFGAHYSYNSGTGVKDVVNELRIDAQWMPNVDWIKSIDFGLNIGDQTKTTNVNSSENASAFSNAGAQLDSERYDHFSVDYSSVENINGFDLFRLPESVLIDGDFENFFKGEPGQHPSPWPRFDYDELFAFYESISPEAANQLIKALPRPKDSYEVNEQTNAIYASVNIEDKVFGFPYALNLGVRAIETTVGSQGYSLNLDKVVFVPDKQGNPSYEGKVEDYQDIVEFEDTYTDVLPSLNLKLNLTDTLLLRTTASKAITRPSIQSLKAWSYINFNKMEYHASNPGLEPLRANQADLALEWYFSENGALTAVYFYKDIESFVINGENGSIDINGETFKVQSSINGDGGGTIEGYEIAYQHAFTELLPAPFNNLGVQLNYTYVDSGYDQVPQDHPEYDFRSLGLPYQGMSEHSYNAVVYYETDEFQLRFAYNWRDEYVANADAWGGPQWVADYGQLDFSASYDITESINLNVSGNNLTNERGWHYISRSDQVHKLDSAGRLFTFGVNVRF
ncbi:MULTISPECIES: TonB-dependent receptor [Pseudoalteromonas]|uniref:TonB-dependent receptor n=1 Tax=Pseudoalteromonas TaxID=53246 RepID=UPI001581740E|nr:MULTISPECIES: TonB-dependent receptor [Pseudoalteromonas]MDI4652347.1 TonB-dependent receptor [Pseudoalteromonas shioyasakiensis]NUJ39243.1 TonB-dependent receptor [Pseudoalteromonas sp. 0303]